MNNRILAVYCSNDGDVSNAVQTAEFARSTGLYDEVSIFAHSKCEGFSGETVLLDDDLDNDPRCRNFINRRYKDAGFSGFLHVVEGSLKFTKNPHDYLTAVERMMSVLDYDVYFNTVCDGCNYVYSKYNPRVSIEVDGEQFKPLGLSAKLSYTSHSNTAYVVYNMAAVPDDLLRFDERFSIAMFYIIEFLARRRNTKKDGQLYFMNQYLTIPEEIGVFKYVENHQVKSDENTMKNENELFRL